MPLISMKVTIPAGESVSDAFGVGAGNLCRIEMPDEWTPANLTFLIAKQGAHDFREAYSVMMDHFGDLMVPVRPGAVAVLGQTTFGREGYVKLHSGDHDNPVEQEEARTFTVMVLRDTAEAPPGPVSATMTDGETVVTIDFDSELDDTSAPLPPAFEVMVKGEVKLVTLVTIAAAQCRLTMDGRYASGPITVSYTKPASGAQLKGTDGDPVVSFFDLSVALPQVD